jgi:hypothetical protein
MIFREWGSNSAERELPLPCDGLLPDANARYHRAVDVQAQPAVVFRWLCQLRAAPYSYDWIDNLGRRSPQQLTPGLEALEIGQPFMQIFDLQHFEPDRSISLRLRRPGLFPPLAVTYAALPEEHGHSRLLVRLAVRFRPGLLDHVARALFPFGDWIMMRRQLLNLKRLAEGA